MRGITGQFLDVGSILIDPSRLRSRVLWAAAPCQGPVLIWAPQPWLVCAPPTPSQGWWWLIIPRTSKSKTIIFLLRFFRQIEYTKIIDNEMSLLKMTVSFAAVSQLLNVGHLCNDFALVICPVAEQKPAWCQRHQGTEVWPLNNIRVIDSFNHKMNLRFLWPGLEWGSAHYPQCSAVYAPQCGLYHNLYSGWCSVVFCLSRGSVSSVKMSAWQSLEIENMNQAKGWTITLRK